jgi:hypothetical protein
MSVKTELISEKVRLLNDQIKEATENGDDQLICVLTDQLNELNFELKSANNALSEGKQLLKG